MSNYICVEPDCARPAIINGLCSVCQAEINRERDDEKRIDRREKADGH